MHNRRNRIIVDGNLQWRLTRRAIGTWIYGGSMIFAFPIALSFFYGVFVMGQAPSAVCQELYQALWFPFLLGVLILPIGIRDSFRFSNRIAGPMMRMKRNMADVAAGEPVRPIQLRPGDFFADVIEQFNHLTENYQRLQAQIAQLTADPSVASQQIARSAEASLQRLGGAQPAPSKPLFPSTAAWVPTGHPTVDA